MQRIFRYLHINKNGASKRQIIIMFWVIAIVCGGFHAWDSRYLMNPDGLSYLDIGEDCLQGGWSKVINGYWSPLYPLLLGAAILIAKPLPYWEFVLVHIVNFVIYLYALICFHYFLRQFIYYYKEQEDRFNNGIVFFSDKTWIIYGYTLFIWSSLRVTGIWRVAPDLFLSAMIYLAFGMLLRIRRGRNSILNFAVLGIILGFAYLTKTVMFLLSFVFIFTAVLSIRSVKLAVPRIFAYFVTFLLISGPFIGALSNSKGRFTFGDKGKLAYAWYINKVRHYTNWQGGSFLNGVPKHPTREICAFPQVYEFAKPIGGTYPPWYDPSYWYEGVTPHFDLRNQIGVVLSNIGIYSKMFFLTLQGVLVVGFITVCSLAGRCRVCFKNIARHWTLLIPTLSAFVLYSLIYVQGRYLGAYIVMLWISLFSGIRFVDQIRRKLARHVIFTMVLLMVFSVVIPTIPRVYSVIKNFIRGGDNTFPVQYQVAKGLDRLGIKAGDRISLLGNTFDFYWSKLLKCKIISEIPDKVSFWKAGKLYRDKALRILKSTGAKAVVSKDIPRYAYGIGWRRIDNTDYYVYLFD